MYHPYFRGKQFELITIRESADLMARSGFVPIIEPVKESLGGLERTLKAICGAGGRAVVIVNPNHGDLRTDGFGITELLRDGYLGNPAISAGILLRNELTSKGALAQFEAHRDHNPTIVHSGFTAPRTLADYLSEEGAAPPHVFVEEHAKLLYRKHFGGSARILIRDGFKRQRNADYPPVEEFSELHVTFEDLGMSGFGDFLIVGDGFSEGGGPAYAVAIHLTFIDPEKDDVMYVYHFVSTDRDTPTDPAGKFAQALSKLMVRLKSGRSKLYETTAIKELQDLHRRGHFPGLGYIKKLSMRHHIETLATYLASR